MATYNFSSVPPPSQYEEEVALVKSMFQEWDEPTLVRILTSTNGNAEAAIDVILAAGSPSQYNAQQMQQQAPPQQQRQYTPQQHQYTMQQPQQQQQDMVMVTAPMGSRPGTTLSITHNGSSFHVRVPPGVSPGGQFIANVPRVAPQGLPSQQYAVQQQQQMLQQQQQLEQQQLEQIQMQQYQQQLGQQQQASQPPPTPPQPKGRGVAVQLPENFLRPPGWSPSAAPASNGMENEMSDEQLAILLQDEMFLQELASHPDFQREFSPSGSQTSATQQTTGTSSTLRAPSRRGSGGTSSGSTSGTSSWSASMRNRLKSMGAQFNRKKRQSEGYGTVGDGEAVTEESPFHWTDDSAGDSSEMVTLTPNGGGNTAQGENASAVRREAEDLDFPPPNGFPSGGGHEVESSITGDELISQSLASSSQDDKNVIRQPSGGDEVPFIDINFEESTAPAPSIYPVIEKPRSAPSKSSPNKEVFDV